MCLIFSLVLGIEDPIMIEPKPRQKTSHQGFYNLKIHVYPRFGIHASNVQDAGVVWYLD